MALTTAAIGLGAASLVGGLFGSRSAAKAQKAQLEAYAKQSEILASLTPPDLMQYFEPTRQAVWLGQMTPEQAVAQLVDASAMEGIVVPQELKDAQYKTLRYLQDIADNSGLTMEDRAKIENIRSEIGAMERGAREASTQQMQQRGIGGSGLEVLQRTMAQQGAAERASQMGFDIAAAAQQRALQAMQQSGQLAGQIRSQEFGEQSQVASAQDAIAKFNAQMAQQAQMANVQAANAAKAQDLERQYQLQQFNIQNEQQDQQRQAQLAQQQWQNLFGQTSAVAGRSGAVGDALGQQAAQSQSQAGQLYGAGAQALMMGLGSRYGQSPAPISVSRPTTIISDINAKTDITELTPQDVDSILDELTGYKYRYTKPELGQGVQPGVMAQDMPPEATTMTDNGLAIDRDKTEAIALAALANINERLHKLEGTNE